MNELGKIALNLQVQFLRGIVCGVNFCHLRAATKPIWSFLQLAYVSGSQCLGDVCLVLLSLSDISCNFSQICA